MDFLVDFLNFFGINDNKYSQCDPFDGNGKGIIIDDYIDAYYDHQYYYYYYDNSDDYIDNVIVNDVLCYDVRFKI